MMRIPLAITVGLLAAGSVSAQYRPKTYCNPMNLDYGYTPIPNFSETGRHRATADPTITLFRGDYYLFSTNQWGYWWSHDMADWHFIPRHFLKPWHHVYDDLCAPATLVLGDTLLVVGSTYAKNFPIWMSTDPKRGLWKEAIDSFQAGAWDPALFLDDDGRIYLYHGSSNTYPLYGWEIDRKTLQPIGPHDSLIRLHDDVHGWERYGEYNDNNWLPPFIEGAWMNKHNGKYYLQYGAPGTEIRGYGDGVYVSDRPLGPFTYQASNPFSYKPGGFARGAGHGATFQDTDGAWWHICTIAINVKNNFERRNGLWPAGFDADGVLYCNTAFGDYPQWLPAEKKSHETGSFSGWMLLNYNKPVRVSSVYGGHEANAAVDEDIRTWWSAATGGPQEWIETDLGALSTVRAIQINYADQDVDTSFLGKIPGLYHQYRIWQSADGRAWTLLVDKSRNRTDAPHDYVELAHPAKTRFLKLENVHMPTGKFAISGFRVFGQGEGAKPDSVRNFIVLRSEQDPRNGLIKWFPNEKAFAYNIYFGTAPDKLYDCIMVYDDDEYYFKAMDRDRSYWFSIEAINENGVSARTKPILVK